MLPLTLVTLPRPLLTLLLLPPLLLLLPLFLPPSKFAAFLDEVARPLRPATQPKNKKPRTFRSGLF